MKIRVMAPAVLDDVVDGDVDRVIAFRPAHLIRTAGKSLSGPVEGLNHADDAARLVHVLGLVVAAGRQKFRLVVLFSPTFTSRTAPVISFGR